MEIQYFGGNCIKINTKRATVVVDDNLKKIGAKTITKPEDIAVFTGDHDKVSNVKLVIDQPGEYEVSDVSMTGLGARAHIEEEGKRGATMYKLVAEDIRIAVIGHVYPTLTEEQLETFGTIDLLVIPVGGHGFTLDAAGALQIIKKIEPKIVIPTYYADPTLNYPVPADELEDAIKALSMEPKDRTSKLKLKSSDLLGADQTQLIIIERQ